MAQISVSTSTHLNLAWLKKIIKWKFKEDFQTKASYRYRAWDYQVNKTLNYTWSVVKKDQLRCTGRPKKCSMGW